MNTHKDTDALIDSIRESVGLDIYGLFEGAEKKRLVVETMLVAIRTGLVLEYLKGFLRPKEVGEQRSKSLGAFVGGLKEDKLPDQKTLNEQLVASLAQLGAASPDQHALALTSFALDLVSAGVPTETAKTLARVISGAIARVDVK